MEKSLLFGIVLFIIDYNNLFSLLINRFGILLVQTLSVYILILSLIYSAKRGLVSMFKLKFWSKFDSSMVFILFGLIENSIATGLISINGKYSKSISEMAGIILLIGLLTRIIYLHYHCKEKNNDLVTLNDIYNNDFEIKNHTITVKEKAADYDLLNRGLLVNEIVGAMIYDHGDGAFTIGIEGKWGAGKTTLINLALKKIQDKNVEVITDFDPWVFGNEESLLNAFSKKILKCLNITYNSMEIKNDLKKINSIVANLSKQSWISDLFDENFDYDGLLEVKNTLSKALTREGKIIIFVFDNLDRASSENILLLFKLIGTVFDLPHINYVLAYDKERLEEVFDKTLQVNRKYMEKIINQVIYIPKPDEQKMREVYEQCIKHIAERAPIYDDTDFTQYINIVSKTVTDLRNFVRLINSSINRVFFYNGILDINELLILELIRFRDPKLYGLLREKKEILIDKDKEIDRDIFIAGADKEALEKKKTEFLQCLETEHSNCEDMVMSLFPFLKKSNQGNEDKVITIRSAKYFGLYFSYGSNDFLIVAHEVNFFIHDINSAYKMQDIEEAAKDLQIFDVDDSVQYEMVNVFYLFKNKIIKTNTLLVIEFLWNHINDFFDIPVFWGLSVRERIEFMITELMCQIEEEKFKGFINAHINSYEHIRTISEIKYWLEHSHEEDAKIKSEIWSLFDKHICKNIIDRKIDLYDDKYYSRNNIIGLLRYESEYKYSIPQSFFINMMKPKYVYRLLGDCIGSSVGSTYGYGIEESLLDEFEIGQDFIERSLEENKPTNESQQFVLELYEKFKNGETFDSGNYYSVQRNKPFIFKDL